MNTLLVVKHDEPLGPLPTEVGIWGTWVRARLALPEDIPADVAAGRLGVTAEDLEMPECPEEHVRPTRFDKVLGPVPAPELKRPCKTCDTVTRLHDAAQRVREAEAAEKPGKLLEAVREQDRALEECRKARESEAQAGEIDEGGQGDVCTLNEYKH